MIGWTAYSSDSRERNAAAFAFAKKALSAVDRLTGLELRILHILNKKESLFCLSAYIPIQQPPELFKQLIAFSSAVKECAIEEAIRDPVGIRAPQNN